MSIVTKTGDDGTTALMYGRRVPKCHWRIQACGAVDELNSALGLARATAKSPFVRDHLLLIQKELVTLMGEIATATQDLERYAKDGFTLVTAAMTTRLENLIHELESQNLPANDWVTPGDNLNSAALDMARSVCRRAERGVCELRQQEPATNAEIVVYLNRLADLLWLMARRVEQEARTRPLSGG